MIGLVYIFAIAAFAAGQGFEDENLAYGNGRAFESQINKTLECVRRIIINGDENLELPPLDPIDIKELSIDLSELDIPAVTGKINFKNVVGKGTAGWQVTHLKSKLTIFPLGAKVETVIGWPANDIAGEYDVDISVLGSNVLKGSGKFSGSTKNFVLDIKSHAVLGKLGIKTLSVRPSLEDIQFSIENLQVNGVDVSKELSEGVSNLDKFIRENVDELDTIISETVMVIVNNNDMSALVSLLLKKCL